MFGITPTVCYKSPKPYPIQLIVVGWDRTEARDSSGEGAALCGAGGHGPGDDGGAWLWRPEVHGGHDAQSGPLEEKVPRTGYRSGRRSLSC